MKRIKSIFTLAVAVMFISAFSFTSCGGKKEAHDDDTELHEDGEHPEGSEHPMDSTEHPMDSTEHPVDTTAH
jgi:hypothetical protein